MVNYFMIGVLVVLLVIVILVFLTFKDQRKFNNRTTSEQAINNIRLDGKIIIITGANSGIGKYAAKILVQSGANVILGCRNSTRAENAKQSIISELKTSMNEKEWSKITSRLHFIPLDLNSFASIKAFANTFKEQYSSLNILINNAGIFGVPFTFSVDGYEKHFAVNYLGHFYLTMLLTAIMRRTNGIKRVINVASIAFIVAPNPIRNWLKFENLDRYLHNIKDYGVFKNYAFSKACNILFAQEYNRRFSGLHSIYAFSLHPGIIGTPVFKPISLPSIIEWLWVNALCKIPPFKSISQGSATTILCATMNENEVKKYGGHYFSDCNEANSEVGCDILDEVNAKMLWIFSERLLKEKGHFVSH